MKKFDVYTEENPLDWQFVKEQRANFVQYRNGAIVKFEAVSANAAPAVGSGEITDQTTASRIRSAFAFGNAECDWLCMSLLTWRNIPEAAKVKRALTNLRWRWWQRWGESLDGWVLEMQARGCPHYHLFHSSGSNFGVACAAAPKEHVVRENGKDVDVVRGGPDWWLRDAWMDCIGCRDAATRSFNARGIIELMRSPDAAGRYVAKESSKREQKELPERYADGLGRWWRLNPLWRPVPRFKGTLDLRYWPYEHPLSHVWDGNDLTPAVVAVESVNDIVLDMETGMITEESNL